MGSCRRKPNANRTPIRDRPGKEVNGAMDPKAKGPRSTTGIFYHPSFSRRSYLTQGSRLQDFPHVLKPLLGNPEFQLYESPLIDEELVLKVHSRAVLDGVKDDPLCSTAWHSAGGVVDAARKILREDIRNAFAFIGAGGHHSGRDFFGGYCCFNDVVMAIQLLREEFSISRIAILDTDAHHGDGTRNLIEKDANILHLCVCSSDYVSPDGTKVDIRAPTGPWFQSFPDEPSSDSLYVETVTREFSPRISHFRPEFLFWYFGFDTHRGDYGDIGLTVATYLALARMTKDLAQQLCQGRLEVVLGGGSRSDIARTVIPPVIRILGD